jgi:hypothetical protein
MKGTGCFGGMAMIIAMAIVTLLVPNMAEAGCLGKIFGGGRQARMERRAARSGSCGTQMVSYGNNACGAAACAVQTPMSYQQNYKQVPAMTQAPQQAPQKGMQQAPQKAVQQSPQRYDYQLSKGANVVPPDGPPQNVPPNNAVGGNPPNSPPIRPNQ